VPEHTAFYGTEYMELVAEHISRETVVFGREGFELLVE
jgi:hypothetical protein